MGLQRGFHAVDAFNYSAELSRQNCRLSDRRQKNPAAVKLLWDVKRLAADGGVFRMKHHLSGCGAL